MNLHSYYITTYIATTYYYKSSKEIDFFCLRFYA